MEKKILSFNDVTVKINNITILSNINFSVNKGDFISLIGPNGSGKTTLLRSIINKDFVKSGKIVLNEKDIRSYTINDMAKEVSYLAQKSDNSLDFTVEEMVSLGRSPYQTKINLSKNDIKIISEAIEKTNLTSLKNRLFSTLSGGERQRTLLARALAQGSKILLLDEPTNHLDIYYSIEFMKLIKNLNKTENLTIIAILHDINLAYRLSNKIGIIKNGKMLAFDEKKNLMDKTLLEEAYNIKIKIIRNDVYNTDEFIGYDIKQS